MNLVTDTVEKLQKYEFASLEEAQTLYGSYFNFDVHRDGPDLCVRVGFGRDGFDTGEGFQLDLPNHTWVRKDGLLLNLAKGLSVLDFAKSYHQFFDERADILPLKRVAIDPDKRSLNAAVTLNFDQASHIMFMQPVDRGMRKIPYSLRRHAVLDIRRSLSPNYDTQYLVLPVAYCSNWMTNLETMHSHRRFLYLEYLNTWCKTQAEFLEEQAERENHKSTVTKPTEADQLTEENPAQYEEIWNMQYGERVGGRQELLCQKSSHSLEVNFVVLPDGKLLAAESTEGEGVFTEVDLSMYEIWDGIPKKAALVKYYAACWGQISVYDFIKHPEGGEYTDRMMFVLGDLEQQIQQYAETRKWHAQSERPRYTQDDDVRHVKIIQTPTWIEQILKMRKEAERAAAEAKQAEGAKQAREAKKAEEAGESDGASVPEEDTKQENRPQTEFQKFADEFGKNLDSDD